MCSIWEQVCLHRKWRLLGAQPEASRSLWRAKIMAGNVESRKRDPSASTSRSRKPWRRPLTQAARGNRRPPFKTSKLSETVAPTFSNSLVKAIFGKRPIASSRTRQVRTVAGHANFLCLGLETLWKESSLCDVTIHIDHHCVSAHRIVLCTFSDYFYDAILGEGSRAGTARPARTTTAAPRTADSRTSRPSTSSIGIHLNELDPMAVQSIVECMYTGKINVTDDNVRDLLDASTFLKIKIITKECEAFLCDNLTKDNCAELLSLSAAYELKTLEELSKRSVARNFGDVSLSEQFLKLTDAHMTDIFTRDDLMVTTELQVLNAALSWLEFNQPPSDVMERMFKTIRLPLLGPQEIMDNVETVDYLMKNSRCQFLVKEALHYHCLPARQSILQSERTVPRACRRYTAILAIGGAPRLVQDQVSANIHYYDPAIGNWTLLTRMPEMRHHHAVAILGGFLYVAGGERTNDQQSPTDRAYRFDPRTDTWLQIADMTTCRESFQLVVLMDMVYAIGGRLNQEESLSSVERYNPALDEWEEVAELSSPRRSMAAATHNGRIYVMGGSGERRISSKVERYNPLLNRWEPRKCLTCPRFFSQLASTKTRMYLVGGATVDTRGKVVGLPYVEAYDPLSDSWTRLRQILEPRAEFGLVLHGDSLYIIGGYSWDRQARLQSVEVYSLQENRSQYIQSISKPYTGISACALTLYHRLDGKPMYHKAEPVIDEPKVNQNQKQKAGNEELRLGETDRKRTAIMMTRSVSSQVHSVYSDLR